MVMKENPDKKNWEGKKHHRLVDYKEAEICPAYISKISSNCEKQIILLMIPNQEEGWYYFAVKNYLHDQEEQHQNIMVILIFLLFRLYSLF